MYRKIYVDIGAHCGDTVEAFLRGEVVPGRDDYRSFEIYAFEPTPYLEDWKRIRKDYPDCDIEFIQKAVGTEGGSIELTVCEDSYGSTTTKDCKNFGNGEVVWVPCVSLSEWLLDNFDEDDYIAVKIDTEGSEFALIESMIVSGAADIVDYLAVEWHNFLLPEQYQKRKQRIERLLPDILHEWH